ncbi:MAG: C10 family peptidase [Syntrophales bacterium]|nr:C10 family peptidase [Syntrophales bacterium]
MSTKVWAVLFLMIWLFPASVPAAPTTATQARRVVQGWLARDAKPLGTILGREVREVQSFPDEPQGITYFVVYLEPQGFVIVPGDDLVEPIIAFVPQGKYDSSLKNPLGAMVSRDVPQRLARVRQAEARAQVEKVPFQPTGSQEQALSKWQSLQSQGMESGLLENQGQESGLPAVSDPRVDPLVATRWSQDRVADSPTGKACYNYYTPPYAAGSASNYPCGCVATAMSQLIRYHQFPLAGVGTAKFTIKVDGREKLEALRGGDGAGGAYNWDKMVAVPNASSTDDQLQAIGALAHDAGAAIKMEYTSSESSAYTSDVGPALINTFKYSSAIVAGAKDSIPIASLLAMINANLDATWPVELGVSKTGSEGGHDVLADGYGYNLSTLYHHLNMGWSGAYDAWYNLPNVDLPSPDNYDLVQDCVYNVYTSGSGEIISGRVTAGGQPVSGAAVQATRNGGGTYAATTNARGIYALAKVPSASTYTIQVTKAGYGFRPRVVNTGTSTNLTSITGNLWGVNFTAVSKTLSGVLELLLMN